MDVGRMVGLKTPRISTWKSSIVFFGIDRAALVQEKRVLREELMDLLAREAADDIFEQLDLLVQEENDVNRDSDRD